MSAAALDERTLEIRLDEPQNNFLYLLGQPWTFAWPRHLYERRGRDWYRDVPLVGNGPFVLTRRLARPPGGRTPGRVTLESAPAWYGARGNVGQVTIELEPSPRAAGERWRDGDYDLIYEFVAERRPWLTGMWTNAIAESTFAEAVLRPEMLSTRGRG